MRVTAVAVVLLVASTASAQNQQASPYSGSLYREGPGFRLGTWPLVLHPGIAIDLGYDSNVFYLPSRPIGSAMLRLRGHFDLATLPPQSFAGDSSTADPKIDFRLSAQLEYREYLTDDARVQAQRSLNALGSANLTILPKGPFTLVLNDTYVHTVDPRNAEVSGNYTRDYNRVGFISSYRRGGLELGLGDFFVVNYWETGALRFADSLADEGQAFVRVRVLPQTTAQLTARAGYIHYSHNPVLDQTPLHVLVGASSLFSRWFGAAANIGYGNSFNMHGNSFNNVIANAEARFFLPSNIHVTLGYDRDFYDSLFANYYVDDHLFVTFEMPMIRRLSARADGGVRFRHYDGLIDPVLVGASGYSTPARDDLIYEAHAELIFQAAAWLALGLNYNLLGDRSDFRFNHVDNSTGMPVVTSVGSSFLKHSVFAQADFAY